MNALRRAELRGLGSLFRARSLGRWFSQLSRYLSPGLTLGILSNRWSRSSRIDLRFGEAFAVNIVFGEQNNGMLP